MADHSEAAGRHIVDDHGAVKFSSLCIDMHVATTSTTNSPRFGRTLQRSLDSLEDFEFSMSHNNMTVKNDLFGSAMDIVAPADKLFFKGQLLPLQADRKLKLVQTLACPEDEEGLGTTPYGGEMVSFKFANGNWASPVKSRVCHEKLSSDEEGFLIMSDGEESYPAAMGQQGEGHHTDVMKYFCLDVAAPGALDASKNDSRSSSFRSQHSSSFWSPADKDSRDSTSSSRCSNGSCQNSFFHAGVDTQIKLPSHLLNVNVADVDNRKPYRCKSPLMPSHSTSNVKSKWSWKTLFTGLKKASKLWDPVAEKSNGEPVPTIGNVQELQKRPVFSFKALPGLSTGCETATAFRRSVGHDGEWQANTYHLLTCAEGSTKRAQGKHQSNKLQWLVARPNEEQQGIIYCLRSGGRQEVSFNGVQERQGEPQKGSKGRNVTIRNAKESWSKCVNKVKKGTKLSSCKHKELINEQSSRSNVMSMMNEEHKVDMHRTMKAKSLSSTPLTKSPVRRSEYSNGYLSNCMQQQQQGGPAGRSVLSSSSSLKNTKRVGFASCPASMRSSPHHSGLLAVVNKPTPDLHTAVQAAIDHCKQSQTGNAAHFDQLAMKTYPK